MACDIAVPGDFRYSVRAVMTSRLVPTILLVLLLSGYLALVYGSAASLPDRVATHFGLNGEPNGWMSRSAYLNFIAAMGVALPLFIVAISFLSRFFPVGFVNVPHKEFWLAPARREETQEALFARSLWLACLIVLFFGALHYTTLVANRNVPVRLPAQLLFPVLGVFVIGIGVWVIALYRRFRRPA